MNLQEFEGQLRSHAHPVIVDFWAPWCVPCRWTKPILESLAKEYQDRVDLLVINADEHPQLLSDLRIFGVPTVVLSLSGDVFKKYAGAQSPENYRKMFEALATAEEPVTITISAFDRFLRLFAGFALAIVGFHLGMWFLLAIGGAISFLGVYDHCPLWKAITSWLPRRTP